MIMFISFCLWIALSFAGVTRNIEAELASYLPAWLVWTNLLLLPIIWAFATGASYVAFPIRLVFYALALCSLVILEICFRRYVWPSSAILSLFLFEVYWLIPKWNS